MVDLFSILGALYNTGIACFPVVGYVFQYMLIRRRQSIGTFSIKVCLILLLSGILRLGFFLFKNYSKALLCQSLLQVTIQLNLLKLCLDVMHNEGIFNRPDFVESFWLWKNQGKYALAIVGWIIIVFSVAELVNQFQLHVLGELLGFGAMAVEATILIPQLRENLSQGRVKGLSYSFVSLNFCQDLNQLVFVVLFFLLLNSMQLMADICLVLQIVYYKCWDIPPSQLNEETIQQTASENRIQSCAVSVGQEVVTLPNPSQPSQTPITAEPILPNSVNKELQADPFPIEEQFEVDKGGCQDHKQTQQPQFLSERLGNK